MKAIAITFVITLALILLFTAWQSQEFSTKLLMIFAIWILILLVGSI
jgi:hypothetical protein